MTIADTAVQGFNYQIVLGGADISGQSNAASLEPGKAIDDVTPFGITWKLKMSGIREWKGQLKLFYNEEAAEAFMLLWAAYLSDNKVDLQLSPKGGSAGEFKFDGKVHIASIPHEAAPDGGAVTVTVDFEGTGQLSFGEITASTSISLTAATVGSDVDWSNPNNCLAEDGSIASASLTAGLPNSRYLVARIGNPSLPADAVIVGLKVTVKRQSQSEVVKDLHICLLNASTVISGADDKADTATNWPAALTNKVYGSEYDDWDAALTPALINGGTIGIGIAAQRVSGASAVAGVDYVDVDIYYINP